MRYVAIGIVGLAVAAFFVMERERPALQPAPSNLAIERTPSQAIVPAEVSSPAPIAASTVPRPGKSELPAVDQPVVADVGFVVDPQSLSWLPGGFLLREGDAILEVNGEPVTSSRQVVEAVRGTSEGSSVELRVRFLRNGTTSTYWPSN